MYYWCVKEAAFSSALKIQVQYKYYIGNSVTKAAF
jgi:hypothetical protein